MNEYKFAECGGAFKKGCTDEEANAEATAWIKHYAH